jgi:chemotaxis protein MotB
MRFIEDQPKAGAPDWIVTFADLMSLLLTFFVLLLSFSSLEVQMFKTMAGSIRNAFGLKSDYALLDMPTGADPLLKPAPRYEREPKKDLDGFMIVKLREALEQSDLAKHGTIEVNDRGVTLRIAGDALFDSGQVELKPGAVSLLGELVSVAMGSPGEIDVEGHTDDVPIANPRFPSNWELSAARAGAAVRQLTAQGMVATRLRAVGFADTRPLAPNDSAANRARNRRIEFLFARPPKAASPSQETP